MSPDILEWLSSIQTDGRTDASSPEQLPPSKNRKRHRTPDRLPLHQSVHPTPPPEDDRDARRLRPPASERSLGSTSTSTSDGGDGLGLGQDEPDQPTPRPTRAPRLSRSASHHSHNSTQSGGSSPRKYLAAMGLYQRRVTTRDFAETSDQPPAVFAMRSRIMTLSFGRGIVGDSFKSALATLNPGPPLHPNFAQICTNKVSKIDLYIQGPL